MKTRIAAVLSILLIGLIANAAFAANPDGAARAQKAWQRMVTKLSLTTDQQTQLQPIFQARMQQMQANHAAARNSLNSILTPDQQATMQKNEAAAKAAREAHEKFDRKAAWASLNLTADQKTQLKNLRKQNHSAMEAQKKQYVAQVEAVLNDTQKSTFEQMMSRHHARNGKAGQCNGGKSGKHSTSDND